MAELRVQNLYRLSNIHSGLISYGRISSRSTGVLRQ